MKNPGCRPTSGRAAASRRSTCMPASASRSTPVDTIPFELGADNRLYVTVYINGQDDRPLRFLLDTGATDVVLNSNSPRTEGLATFTGSVENSGANSVETIPSTAPSQVVRMGSRAISGLKLIAIPYPPDAWDGVLAYISTRYRWTGWRYPASPELFLPLRLEYKRAKQWTVC